MRIDGRKNDELRSITIIPNYIAYPEGSVLLSLGNTIIICNASVQEGVPTWMEASQKPGGWITSEYSLLPRSTQRRTPRELHGFSGRSQEIRRMIGRSLRAAVDLTKIGNYTYTIDCDVIQADGGTRTAAITGGYVALSIALKQLMRNGLLVQNPVVSPIAAISVGIVDDDHLLDLCYDEDHKAQVDINVAINADGQYVEVQGTAEGSPFSREEFADLLDLAYEGIGELLLVQQEVLASL